MFKEFLFVSLVGLSFASFSQAPGYDGYQNPGYGYNEGPSYGYGGYNQGPSYGYGGYSSPGYGYQSPGYGYQSPGYGYQSPGYGYQSPGYGYQSPGYGYSSPGYGYQSPGYGGYSSPGYGGYNRGPSYGYGGYDQGGYGYNGYNQPYGFYQYSQFNLPSHGYNRPSGYNGYQNGGYGQPTNQYSNNQNPNYQPPTVEPTNPQPTPPTTPPTNPNLCDDNYQGGCYHFSWNYGSTQLTWNDAKNYCENRNMRIISLDVPAKSTYFLNVLGQSGQPWMWIGSFVRGHDLIWENGNVQSPIVPGSGDWSRTRRSQTGRFQPENKNECVAVLNNFYGDGVKWHDIECHHRKPTICEAVP